MTYELWFAVVAGVTFGVLAGALALLIGSW